MEKKEEKTELLRRTNTFVPMFSKEIENFQSTFVYTEITANCYNNASTKSIKLKDEVPKYIKANLSNGDKKVLVGDLIFYRNK